MTPINDVKELLRYEIGAAWWTGYIGGEVLQRAVSRYFARKLHRKYSRYQRFCEEDEARQAWAAWKEKFNA